MFLTHKKSTFWFTLIALLVFGVAFLASLRASTLSGWLMPNDSPLQFRELQGGLWQGEGQLYWQGREQTLALGQVAWQHSAFSWLRFQPHLSLNYQRLGTQLRLDTRFGLVQQDAHFQLQNASLSLRDWRPVLAQLVPAIGAWLQGVEADLQGVQLQTDWRANAQWLANTQGSGELIGVTFLGERLPPIQLKLEQQQQILVLSIRAQEGWRLHGEIRIQPSVKSSSESLAWQYEGQLTLDADQAEQMPNWASLMRSTAPNRAEMRFQGQGLGR
ncbi:MAG: hypothetical protein JXR44_09545 [Thiotrichales bacterium]|nr:hypothetical protein [Thiotrichales bacterium]